MDRRIKTKVITTIVCMVLSLIALYAFCFVLEVTMAWRIFLILLAVSWIASGITNLYTYFKR